MTEQLKHEIGLVVRTWHIIAFIAGLIFSAGGVIALTDYRLNKVEVRVEKLEEWKEVRVEVLHKLELDVRDIKNKTDFIYQELRTRLQK